MNRGTLYKLIALSFILAACAQAPATPSAGSAELTRVFDDSPTGITFRYPEAWKTTIPMQGLMLVGEPETLNNNQPGATFTVQRTQPLSVYGSLAEALDLYLRRGPLSAEKSWQVLGEITQGTFLDRDALIVDVQGKENDASPEQRAHVVVTVAENSFVYVFILTAPVESWPQDGATLNAILETVEILE